MQKKSLLRLAVLLMLVGALCFVAVSALAEGEAAEAEVPMLYGTFWALLPPIIAIALALITKEVYSSLFIGVVIGALFASDFQFEATIIAVVSDGLIGNIADAGNAGILVFLVVLGIIVALVNKAGGSAAYGRWAVKNIKSERGALGATFGLGCLIFVDDYFNCLTVGSVMKPVTDAHKVSREKLAYIIDATAAPVCMIAPISSWAAALAGVVEGDGMAAFINAIPYNFYSLCTLFMVLVMIAMKLDFGPMAKAEKAVKAAAPVKTSDAALESRGKVIDLVFPVVVLIVCCILGMLQTGGFFAGENLVNAFANCDATLGLPMGALVALVITFVFYMVRRTISFKDFMESIPAGFLNMVPAILILVLAWSLGGMTGNLGADVFVEGILKNTAAGLNIFLPCIVFLISAGLAFASGTSWGTFLILIPIITGISHLLPANIVTVAISACLAGAVCGDHVSPISDTTIMASSGAECDHLKHVSTQIPYAVVVMVVSAVSYIITGILGTYTNLTWLGLPIALALTLIALLVIRAMQAKKAA